MTTVHPSLAGGGEGGPVPWHPHDGGDLSGQATFLTVHVENLLAGTIDSKEIVISGGTDGVIRSDNFETGVSGWAIFGDGSIEARSITIVAAAGSEVDWSFIQNVSVATADIEDAAIVTAKIGNAAITTAKIGNAAVTNAKIESAAITASKIGNAAITTAKIENTAITTAKIGNAAVTNAKIGTMSANKLTAGTIDASVISVTNLDASEINAGIITAIRYRTASSGDRIEINPGSNVRSIDFFDGAVKVGSLFYIESLNRLELQAIETGRNVGLRSVDARVLINGSSGTEVSSPSDAVALTAYRQGSGASGDIAHFRSDTGDGTDNLHALIKRDGNMENTNNSYGGLSDERLKENIETARSYLEDLRKVRITTHTLKSTGKKLLGPIAQELQPIFPGLVRENDDGYFSVKHSVFVPMAITAIQELADERDVMKDRLDRMESRLAVLEAA